MTVAVAFAALVVLVRAPRMRRRQRHRGVSSESTLLFVEMVALGVSSGLSFPQSAAMAAGEVGGEVGSAAGLLLRGVAADRYPSLAEVFVSAQRAAVTGAPLLPALDGRIGELRAAQRYARLERIRKLPVKLLFPLALLVLPGFLLLTVGPVIAGSLQRLGL